jgi:hypothetical protein
MIIDNQRLLCGIRHVDLWFFVKVGKDRGWRKNIVWKRSVRGEVQS